MSAWISSNGGSGSGVYDPVTTTEGFPGDQVNVRFVDHGDFKRNGRTHNFGTYKKSRMKSFCDEIRNRSRPKCLVIAGIAFAGFVLILLIIAITSNRRGSTAQPPNTNRHPKQDSIGLRFKPQPVDASSDNLISFSVTENNTFVDYVQQLNSVLAVYNLYGNYSSDLYVQCSKNNTPPDKVCLQSKADFGTSCKLTHNFGYKGGQPCVFLYFDLPKDHTMRGLVPKDTQYVEAEKVMGPNFSSEYIGISCQTADKQHLGFNYSFKHIVAQPSQGMPAYYFRQRTIDPFISPAVMVQFNTILTSRQQTRIVHVTCTAYGKVLDSQGAPVNDKLYQTSFAFKIQ